MQTKKRTHAELKRHNMRIPVGIIVCMVFLVACNDAVKKDSEVKDNRITLTTDSINVVKISDTLVINESICRGCEYEGSVRFKISDSLELVKLEEVISYDDNPSGMDGGTVGKEVILVPVKPGITTIRLYKLLSDNTAKEDSARFKRYTIEIKN